MALANGKKSNNKPTQKGFSLLKVKSRNYKGKKYNSLRGSIRLDSGESIAVEIAIDGNGKPLYKKATKGTGNVCFMNLAYFESDNTY